MKVLSQYFFSPIFQPIQGLHLASKYSIIYLLEKIMYSTSSWSSLPLSIHFPACDLLVANWSLALNPPPLAHQAIPSPTLLAQPSHLLFTYRSIFPAYFCTPKYHSATCLHYLLASQLIYTPPLILLLLES